MRFTCGPNYEIALNGLCYPFCPGK
jgi:hypothetical protein